MGDVMSSVLDCDVGGACKALKWGCCRAAGYTSPKHLYIPGGPMVKNLPSNAGDMDSIPGLGTEIPYATGQLSLCTAMREQPNK